MQKIPQEQISALAEKKWKDSGSVRFTVWFGTVFFGVIFLTPRILVRKVRLSYFNESHKKRPQTPKTTKNHS